MPKHNRRLSQNVTKNEEEMQVINQKDLFESLKCARVTEKQTQMRLESWLDRRNKSVDLVKNIIERTE